MIDIYSTNRRQLFAWLQKNSLPTAQAKLIFSSIYKKSATFLTAEKNGISNKTAKLWQQDFEAKKLSLFACYQSCYDHSVKLVLALSDKSLIETVIMPESNRITICVSCQVGCAQRCSFCHTGRMGLKRHLSTGEIIAQVIATKDWIDEHPAWREKTGLQANKLTNVVFMGMGEPLDNVNVVNGAIDIMTDHWCLGIPTKKITVSTAGHLDGLKVLLSKPQSIGLALSFHQPDMAKRSQIMPINRRYPINEVLEFLRSKQDFLKQPLFIQYTLIDGVNDSVEDAVKLSELLYGLPVKVNIIPLNPVKPSRFSGPQPEHLNRFRQVLHQKNIRSMIRYSKGQDIEAACGQLVTQLSSS